MVKAASQRATRSKKRRLSAEDWVVAAIDALRDEGPAALRIASLSRRLGVTPGSFYWHFRDRDDLRNQLLRYWKTELISGVAAAARLNGKDTTAIRSLPALLIARKLPDLDVAMRKWGREDPVVAAAVAQADAQRIRAVTAMCKELGLDERQARRRALQLSWAFRGSAGTEEKERLRVLQDLADVLLPGAN